MPSKKKAEAEIILSEATVIEAEGARVAFAICKRCGAALFFDPRNKPPNPAAMHYDWHRRLDDLADDLGRTL